MARGSCSSMAFASSGLTVVMPRKCIARADAPDNYQAVQRAAGDDIGVSGAEAHLHASRP